MPAAKDMTANPPITHGIPDAPSAAIDDRFRRPTDIMTPHTINPPTPPTSPTHFIHDKNVVAIAAIPGGATGAGFGTSTIGTNNTTRTKKFDIQEPPFQQRVSPNAKPFLNPKVCDARHQSENDPQTFRQPSRHKNICSLLSRDGTAAVHG